MAHYEQPSTGATIGAHTPNDVHISPDEKEHRLTEQTHERARVDELAEEATHALYSLTTAEEWLKHSHETGLFDEQPDLEMVALSRLEDSWREYARAYTKHRAAQVVADWEPLDDLTYEQRERLARLMLRVDAFANTRILLEDVPEEVIGLHERWVMLDAICDAVDAASEEVELYQQELGLEADDLRREEEN